MAHKDIYVKGKKLTSVTQIPSIIGKPFLDVWKAKLCHCITHAPLERKSPFKEVEKEAFDTLGPGHCGMVYGDYVKDAAGDLGTDVHQIIEDWFNDKESSSTNSQANSWATKIIEIYKEHKVVPHIAKPEELFVDEESGLNGSIDHTILWDGVPELADLKIKGSLDEFTGVQGYLYRYLIKRKYNVDFRWMRIMWCQKDSVNQEVVPVRIDLDEWKDVSHALVTIWNKQHKSKQVHLFE